MNIELPLVRQLSADVRNCSDSTGIIDYGSLIYIGLQRSRTAREAIKIMTDLVQQYGYYSEGESFTIADPNEIWIMEMIGKGPGIRGAVWVAVRVPDDCISPCQPVTYPPV